MLDCSSVNAGDCYKAECLERSRYVDNAAHSMPVGHCRVREIRCAGENVSE